MNRKKEITFHINNHKQVYGEFHENTKLKMVRSYFKDLSHFNNFELSFNGRILYNDESILRDICNKSTKMLFIIIIKEENANIQTSFKNEVSPIKPKLLRSSSQGRASIPNQPINCNHENLILENSTLKIQNDELLSQIEQMKNQNINFSNYIQEANSKIQILQRSNDNISTQNFNLNKFLENLKAEYMELDKNFKIAQDKLDKYEKAYSSVVKENDKMRRVSVKKSSLEMIDTGRKSLIQKLNFLPENGGGDNMKARESLKGQLQNKRSISQPPQPNGKELSPIKTLLKSSLNTPIKQNKQPQKEDSNEELSFDNIKNNKISINYMYIYFIHNKIKF
jgi:hypothetical protein